MDQFRAILGCPDDKNQRRLSAVTNRMDEFTLRNRCAFALPDGRIAGRCPGVRRGHQKSALRLESFVIARERQAAEPVRFD